MNALAGRLVAFANALREHGVPVGPGETVDAAAATDAMGLADRERLRAALACCLIRRGGQRSVFDELFDLYFPSAVGDATAGREPADDGSTDDVPALRDELVATLATGDAAASRALAAAAVATVGRYGTPGGPGNPGSQGSGDGASPGTAGYSAYQTLDALRPNALLNRILAAMRTGDGAMDTAVARTAARAGIAAFTEQVRTEARRRTAELRGADRIARHAVAGATEELAFSSATREQLAEMRRTVRPLARKLATRLAAQRRRARRGQIDVRRTLRRSMATGGVPMRPVLRARRPVRPELVLLCDMSGSVANFAQFTLLLVQALSESFSKVRSFAFVNRTDEITELVRLGEPEALAGRILTEANLTTWGENSHYGDALATFLEGWPDAVGPRTSVLVLGDGRTNGGAENVAALREIAGTARAVYWLNPEAEQWWGSGDSAAQRYGAVVPMYECRTIRQLSTVVTELLH